MRSFTVSCLLATICSVAVAATEAPIASSVAHGSSEVMQSSAAATPLIEEIEVEGDVYAELELRQATGIVTGATQAPQQYPSITVQYPQTVLPNGVTTNVAVTYIQTFATYPENWATAAIPAGEIGLGTLKKTKNNKRDAEPTVAIFVIPIEMVLQTVNIVEPIFQVLPINVTQPVTSHHISFVNATDEPSAEASQYPLSSIAQNSIAAQSPTSHGSSSFPRATESVYNLFSRTALNASFSRLPSIGFGTGSISNYGTGARFMSSTGFRNDITLFPQPTSNRNTSIDIRLIETGVARATTGNNSLVIR